METRKAGYRYHIVAGVISERSPALLPYITSCSGFQNIPVTATLMIILEFGKQFKRLIILVLQLEPEKKTKKKNNGKSLKS